MFYEIQEVVTASRHLPADTPKNEVSTITVMDTGLFKVASDTPDELFSYIGGPMDPCCLLEQSYRVKKGSLVGYPSVELISESQTIRAHEISAAAFETTRTQDNAIVSGAPAIIIHRSGDYKPGEWIEDKGGIFVRSFAGLVAGHGSLDLKLDWFDAAEDLGPNTFNGLAKTIANDTDGGRGGLRLDPARYEAELFEKLKTGEATGKLVIGPLPIVQAIYWLRNTGEYRRRAEENLPGRLVTAFSFGNAAHWQWTCSPKPNTPGLMQGVDFTGTNGVWGRPRSYQLSGRACFAVLAL